MASEATGRRRSRWATAISAAHRGSLWIDFPAEVTESSSTGSLENRDRWW